MIESIFLQGFIVGGAVALAGIAVGGGITIFAVWLFKH